MGQISSTNSRCEYLNKWQTETHSIFCSNTRGAYALTLKKEPLLKNEFTKLDTTRRLDVIWAEAEVISEKVYYECNISLFLLDSFYVEVFFNRDLNQVVGIEVQESPQILHEYIKDLDLSELQNLLR